MSRNKLQGYEEVDISGELFLFKGDFGFLVELKEISEVDPIAINEYVVNLDAMSIRNVLVSSLRKKGSIDADDISLEEKYSIIEDTITSYGLQECGILSQHILSNAMVGDLKKNAIDSHQNIQTLLNSLVVSRSRIFKNHAFLWTYLLVIFGTFQWLNTKLSGMLIALN